MTVLHLINFNLIYLPTAAKYTKHNNTFLENKMKINDDKYVFMPIFIQEIIDSYHIIL